MARNTQDSGWVSCDYTNVTQKQIEARKHEQDESESAENRSTVKELFRNARDIYRAGPPGEGQEFWECLKNYRRAKRTVVTIEMCPTKHTDEVIRVQLQNSPIEPIAAGKLLEWPTATLYVQAEGTGQVRPRQDSVISYDDISRTSREIPVKIRQTILGLDTSKPLPRTPPLSAVPRSRRYDVQGKTLNLDKPLPQTPFPHSSKIPKPCQKDVNESPTDPSWLFNHVWTVGSESSVHKTKALWQSNSTYQDQSKYTNRETQLTVWPKELSKKVSNTCLRVTSKSCSNKATTKVHDTLKAKISGPTPIETMADVSLYRAAIHPGTVTEDVKRKQKTFSSPTWLSKLAHPAMPTLFRLPMMHKAKKRPASYDSFACQGLVKGHVIDAGSGLC